MINLEGVWKQYRLGNTVDLGRTFREAVMQNLLRRASPQSASDKSFFWALKDINLQVESGRSLGLIGHNGAGKSTLLKVLSQITHPTRGKITIQGSMSSLLEVGTGFHPELSGRENIFLYGAIMGMSRNDIRRKFDQIVDYAGVETFLDTPVKRYSSGMYVRLAFSIAAHVEPDILVVDEVLAVGDKEFRDKCLGKMEDVAESGRTVIFVSHNMHSVTSLCQNVVWMDHGAIKQVGETTEIVSAYENSIIHSTVAERAARSFSGNLIPIVSLSSLTLQENDDAYTTVVDSQSPIKVIARWHSSESLRGVTMSMALYSAAGRLLTLNDCESPTPIDKGYFESHFDVPAGLFKDAELSLAIGGKEDQQNRWCWATDVAKINVVDQAAAGAAAERDILKCKGYGTRRSL